MALGEVIVRVASLGLELVDELTDDSLIGDSHITVARVSTPDEELTTTSFLVGRSRWVFENLGTEQVIVTVESDFYFTEVLETGQTVFTQADPAPTGIDIPSVVATPGDARIARVRLRPRTGYPFPTALTRVVGSVLLDGAPVVGADVAVTPRYQVSGSSTPAPGTPVFLTHTTGDGQFVAWLFPNLAEDFPTPVAFDVQATFGAHTRTLTNQPLVSQTVNGVTIPLT